MKHRLLVGRIFKVSTYLFICEKRLIIQIFTLYEVQRDSCMKLKNIHASWKFFWLLLEKFRSDGQASKEKGISFKLYGLLIHLIFLAEIHIGRGLNNALSSWDMLEEIKSWFHSGAKVDTQLLTSNISISTQNVWKLETHFNKRIACKCLVVIILMRLNVAENFSKIQDLDYETPFAPEFWCIPWSTKGFSLFSAYLNQENLALFTSTLRWNHFTLFVVHLHTSFLLKEVMSMLLLLLSTFQFCEACRHVLIGCVYQL